MAKKVTEQNTPIHQDLTRTENFIDTYKTPLLVGAGLIVVIILVVIGYKNLVSDPHELESKGAYWNAFYDFEADSLEAAVQGSINNAGFEELAADYEGTSGGDISNYSMGIISMKKNDFQAALDYFDACDFSDVMLGSVVMGLKGDCHVELGDYETAVDYFEKAADRDENQFTSPMFYKKAGLTYEALNNNEKAVSAYQKIKDQWPASSEAQDIEKFIARTQK